MKRLVLLILEAHQDDIRSLRDFSQRGENRVLIIPGNHDASLLVPSVWSPIGERLDEHSGRITIVKEGIWNSSDGKVLVEHGHQIGADVNRFADWPVVLREDHGRQGLVRTWGERFVQKIFNERERQYQIIDNLSPESAGAAYLLGNRGVGGSAQDLATFVKFHLFELSWAQRWQELGTTKTEKWDSQKGRQLGWRLFVDGLERSDPLLPLFSGGSGDAIKDQLTNLALSLQDSEVQSLCDRLAAVSEKTRCASNLSALASQTLPKAAIMQYHLNERLRRFSGTRIFVYGHTHQREQEWKVQTSVGPEVRVLNTGTFQRVIEKERYLELVEKLHISPSDGLQKLTPENLPPCYTAVEITYKNFEPTAKTLFWRMDEDGRAGELKLNWPQCSALTGG
jgi:UDP-2,3-diacylglucosamine pyrophosphatase LpxH